MPERGMTTNRANSNPQQTFAGRHGSRKRPRCSFVKGGGFVKYYGLKTGYRRMEIWRLHGIRQD